MDKQECETCKVTEDTEEIFWCDVCAKSCCKGCSNGNHENPEERICDDCFYTYVAIE